MLAAAVADRVRRLIPMLSSPHDGEALATRNAIGRELAAGGADWHALAAALAAPGQTHVEPSSCSAEPPSFGDTARACRDLDRGRLTVRERTFVEQMCARGFSWQPSPKQRAWMHAIFESLRPRAAA